MPKKRVGVSLRQSSPAPEASTEVAGVDAFVSGAALALAAAEIPAAKLEELRRLGPEGYRELCIYLPEALAQKLCAHCLEHNIDLSRLVATTLEQYLNGQSASDARTAERTLASARALLSDLAGWVRVAWATRRRHWPARATAGASS